jgi:arsenate reductase (thioredoxin)
MLTILILGTSNSCRSILAEAIINHLAGKRLHAISAGSYPSGTVTPETLMILKNNGISTEGFSSKSWDIFDGTDIDIAITVCDQVVVEMRPAYLKNTIKAHWSIKDPTLIVGSKENENPFQATYDALKERITKMLAFPLEDMTHMEISKALNVIDKETAETENVSKSD